MPQSRTPKQPKYRRQTGRKGDPSFVELDEVRHYLATYRLPESRERYERLLAGHKATSGRRRAGHANHRGRTGGCVFAIRGILMPQAGRHAHEHVEQLPGGPATLEGVVRCVAGFPAEAPAVEKISLLAIWCG